MSDSHLPWKWTRRFGVGLSVSVAAFCAWGALAPHVPMATNAAPMAAGVLMAALYGNSQRHQQRHVRQRLTRAQPAKHETVWRRVCA